VYRTSNKITKPEKNCLSGGKLLLFNYLFYLFISSYWWRTHEKSIHLFIRLITEVASHFIATNVHSLNLTILWIIINLKISQKKSFSLDCIHSIWETFIRRKEYLQIFSCNWMKWRGMKLLSFIKKTLSTSSQTLIYISCKYTSYF
jgi:hypothetical protein